MTVSAVVLSISVEVTPMVTGAAPQSNVMTPAFATAAFRALNVQLAAVPVPTTVVGCDTSAGIALEGRPALQRVGIVVPPVPPVPMAPPVPLAPLDPPAPPLPFPPAP